MYEEAEIIDSLLKAIENEANSEKIPEFNGNPFRGSFNSSFNNSFNKDIMMMKEKKDLKSPFCGVNSLYMVKGEIKDLATIDFSHDMPVLVDTLNYTEGEPTRNPVNVHGLDSAWCTMFESGETTFACDIPTMHPDVLEFFWGTPEKQTSTVNGESWVGNKYNRNVKQIKIGFGILSGDGTKMFIVQEADVIASNVFESGSTTPHLVRVTGSVNADNFVFLEKKEEGAGA